MEEKGVYRVEDKSSGRARIPGRLIEAPYEFVNYGDILVLKGVYPYAADLVRVAEMVGAWRQSTLASGAQRIYLDKGMRSSSSMTISKKVMPIFEMFEDALEFCLEGALKLYQVVNRFASVKGHSEFELLRYGLGEKFDEHVDVISDHPLWGYRRISVLCYLNDDYEGGELYFPRQSITYKPSAGSIVLFPSDFTYPHGALPVTKGTKYSVVTWFS